MKTIRLRQVVTLILLPLFVPGVGAAEEQNPVYDFPGPYRAEVVRVIDGDTVVLTVELWPNLQAEVAARVRGVNAPELSSYECETAELLAQQAKSFVQDRYVLGDIVQLRDVKPDPFFGRVVADVRRWRSDRWLPLAKELLEADPPLAVEWLPNQGPVPWCLLTMPE